MSEIHRVNDFVETASGRFFHLEAPEFDIETIATHLGRINRFSGACQSYSVAEHCWHVSHLCRDPLEGLMHDAPEFLICDLASPWKRRPELAGYRELEQKIWRAMAKHFGLNQELSADTHYWDNAMAFIEADWLMPSGGRHWPGYENHVHLLGTREIHCWDPPTAKRKFLDRFQDCIHVRDREVMQALDASESTRETLQEVFNG